MENWRGIQNPEWQQKVVNMLREGKADESHKGASLLIHLQLIGDPQAVLFHNSAPKGSSQMLASPAVKMAENMWFTGPIPASKKPLLML
jgi:hypothetical protein